MRSSPFNYQQPGRASACERGAGRRTLATSSQDPSRAAAVRGRLRALCRRLLPTQRGCAPGAVLPPPTGCRLPCSPTLASWCCWEVGTTLPPLARRLRSEGRELPSDIPWASWGLLCGPVSQAGRSAPCALFSSLTWPGTCRTSSLLLDTAGKPGAEPRGRPSVLSAGRSLTSRHSSDSWCQAAGWLGSPETFRIPSPLGLPWQGTSSTSLRPGLQNLVLPTES